MEARSLESEDGVHLREMLSASVDGVEQVQEHQIPRRLMKPLTWISLLAENHLMVTRRMAEIVETRRKNCSDKLEFETLMKRLNYLEQVISETLRLYPPGLT
ncbi:hypothetical protein HPB51_000635 [Rhipicephalus microplus]|uniref:Uncharacterized protein n=1 Tax=Rhipicephalus microplus TaxID=6941 RepID=A0A9J6DDY1_RHIMP|nr:hypothetical protein HPB51_000635 [Rhipicephalus microplus]